MFENNKGKRKEGEEEEGLVDMNKSNHVVRIQTSMYTNHRVVATEKNADF